MQGEDEEQEGEKESRCLDMQKNEREEKDYIQVVETEILKEQNGERGNRREG